MASVNWMKLKGGSRTSAIIAHITRHDWKEGVKYSNPDVDESRADCNYVICGLPQTSGMIRSRLDKRVKELDAIKPPELEKSLFEANLQLYEAKCTLDEERAKIGGLGLRMARRWS